MIEYIWESSDSYRKVTPVISERSREQLTLASVCRPEILYTENNLKEPSVKVSYMDNGLARSLAKGLSINRT